MIQETIVNLESCGVWFQNILPPPRQILPVVPQLIMPIKLVVPRDGVDAMRVEKFGNFVARFI